MRRISNHPEDHNAWHICCYYREEGQDRALGMSPEFRQPTPWSEKEELWQ